MGGKEEASENGVSATGKEEPGLGSEGRMEEETSFTCSSVFTECLPWAGHCSRSLMEKRASSEGTVGWTKEGGCL